MLTLHLDLAFQKFLEDEMQKFLSKYWVLNLIPAVLYEMA